MTDDIIGLERRVRGLMDDHERLLAILVVDETDEGWYAIVVRDWDHPSDDVDARILSERYAYLTKGDGNDGWLNSGKGDGGNGINRRDPFDQDGRLAGALAKVYSDARNVQQGKKDAPTIGRLRDGR